MLHDLSGKTALVTGAGKRSGIGFAIAQKLASLGSQIILADLGPIQQEGSEVGTGTPEEMEELALELNNRFKVHTLAVAVDVTDNPSIQAMVKTIKDRINRIDILCNNAGASFGVPNTVLHYEEAAWMKTIDVNLHGVFRISRAVLPLMTGKTASIINTASRAGKVPPLFFL